MNKNEFVALIKDKTYPITIQLSELNVATVRRWFASRDSASFYGAIYSEKYKNIVCLVLKNTLNF